MKHSTTFRNILGKAGRGLLVAAFWLLVWQAAYVLIAQEILFVSPVQAFTRLFSLAVTAGFWKAVGMSCVRVLLAFALAVLTGVALAALCARFRPLYLLTRPLMGVVRATPVASFIILALVWFTRARIPVFAAYLMVTPMIWGNTLAGIRSADKNLLEMAALFSMPALRVVRGVYIPAALPHFISACSAGLGFAWKSAVAAEVIAPSTFSVGKQLYDAKIYIRTDDLFAWTIAIILVSLAIERLVGWLLARLGARLGAKGGEARGD